MLTTETTSTKWAGKGILVLVTLTLFTDLVSYDLVVPILPEYARNWNINEEALGLLFGFHPLALLLSIPFAAWVCDRFGPVRGLQVGCAGLFASQALFAIGDGRIMLFAARGLQGVSGGIAGTAGLALLAVAFSAEKRSHALCTAMSVMSLGALVGPPLGGFLFTWGGPACPFIAMAAWSLVLAVALTFLPAHRFRTSTSVRPSILSGWRDYLGTVAVVMLGAAFMSALEPTLPLHLEERFRATPSQCGLLFGLAALVYGLSAPLANWAAERWGNRRVMAGGVSVCLLIMPLLALPHSWIGVASLVVAFGVGCAFLLTPALPEIAILCERSKHPAFGAAYASFNLAYAFGMFFGAVMSGFLKQHLGFGLAMLVFSVLAVFVLALLAAGQWNALRWRVAANQGSES